MAVAKRGRPIQAYYFRKPVDYSICVRFRMTRKENNRSVKQFAEDFGISTHAVKQIEMKRYRPRIEIIILWKKLFDKSYEWILEGDSSFNNQ